MATHPLFEGTIILAVIASCVQLTVADSELTRSLDYVMLAVFTTETVVKCMAFGVWQHPGTPAPTCVSTLTPQHRGIPSQQLECPGPLRTRRVRDRHDPD